MFVRVWHNKQEEVNSFNLIIVCFKMHIFCNVRMIVGVLQLNQSGCRSFMHLYVTVLNTFRDTNYTTLNGVALQSDAER